MGEKGSLKNLYKSFRFFLANQKKKKKEKKLDKKVKMTKNKFKSQTKLSFFVVLTILGGFINSLFSKNDDEIVEIKNDKDLKKVKQTLIIISNEIKKTNELTTLEKTKQQLVKLSDVCEKTDYLIPDISSVKKEIKDLTIINEEKIIVVKKKEEKTLEKVKSTNEQLNLEKEKISEINTKVSASESKEELFDLKKEIEKLEEKYKDNKLTEEDMKMIDQFLLLYNTEEIKKLKAKIDNKIKALDIKEEELIIEPKIESNQTKETSLNEKKEVKKIETLDKKSESKEEIKQKDDKEEQQKKEDIPNSYYYDIKSMNSLINKQILSVETRVHEIIRFKNKKPLFFNKIGNLISSTLRLCASLSPLFIFKNKIVGSFTSAILLNNSIRGLRRSIMSNKKNLPYIRTNGLENLIKEQADIEQRTRDVFYDSLYQISMFKKDFISTYGIHINSYPELNNMFEEINNIEKYVLEKQEQYARENEQVKIKLKRYQI